jgi:hypothetical protein
VPAKYLMSAVFKDLDGNISTELGKASESMLMLQSMTLYRLTCIENV